MIVYEEQEETDPSLEEPVTELVQLEEEKWTIPPKGSKTVKAKLKVPEEPFDGIKLGGFYFEKEIDEEKDDAGLQIENKYAHLVGLQLSQNDHVVEPELDLLSVAPELVNHRTSLVAELQNKQPLLMDSLRIDAKVYRDEEQGPFKEHVQDDIRMAPNSTMDVVIDWLNEPLIEGDYLLELIATDGETTWEWKEPFTIGQEAEQLNKDAVEITEPVKQSSWYTSSIVVLSIIILLLVGNILRLKKRNGADIEQ